MRPFEYFAPTTLEEAVSLLSKYGDKAKVLAGGTDLVVKWNRIGETPECVVSLKDVPNLSYICEDSATTSIGAMTTHRMIEQSQMLLDKFPALAQSSRVCGSVQNRNRGTLVGNICNASPGADSSPALLVHDATVNIVGPSGERDVKISDFFLGPGQTCLKRDEIVTRVSLCSPCAKSGSAFIRNSPRKAMDISVVCAACFVCFEDDGNSFKDVRFAFGAVAPTPIRVAKAEELLKKGDIEAAAEAAAEEVSPIDDIRGSAEYRREIVKVLIKRTYNAALGAA